MTRHGTALARGMMKKALHVTKGATLNVKPQVHAGSRQAVRNAKFCASLHVPVAWATEVLPMQVGGDCLLSVRPRASSMHINL